MLAMDLNGKSDPYCLVQMGQQCYRTKTITKTLDPVWNEECKMWVMGLESPLHSLFDVGRNR